MDKEPVPNVPVVTKFVREVIGCNCPDEVFRHIEIQRGSSAVKACSADCELRIGGRLLILVTAEPIANLSARLGQVIAEGKPARDEHKFNRFRLVVQTENAIQEREKLLCAFEEVAEKDERTHLHVLVSGRDPSHRARYLWQWVGDPQRSAPRSPWQLATRNEFYHAGER